MKRGTVGGDVAVAAVLILVGLMAPLSLANSTDVIVTKQPNGVGPQELWAAAESRVMVPEEGPYAGWSSPEGLSLSESTLGDAHSLQAAWDGEGNAVAVWVEGLHRESFYQSVFASRYDPKNGWAPGVDIALGSSTYSPDIAMLVNRTATLGSVRGPYDAVAVWHDMDTGSIYATFGDSGNSWSTPEVVGNANSGGFSSIPQVSVDSAGNATVIWSSTPTGPYGVFVRRFSPVSGWRPVVTLDANGDQPQLAMNPNGDAVAIWRRLSATVSGLRVYASRFTNSTGWGVPVNLSGPGGSFPLIAANAYGDTIAMWLEPINSTTSALFARRLVVPFDWGPTEQIATLPTLSWFLGNVALDATGRAVAVWQSLNSSSASSQSKVYGSYFTPTDGWKAPFLLGQGVEPRLAIAASGEGMAAFEGYSNDTGNTIVRAARFHPGTGWGPTTHVGDGYLYAVAMVEDPGSTVFFSAPTTLPRYQILARRFVPTSGWQAATKMDVRLPAVVGPPQVGVDRHGNGVAVWAQGERIWSRWFIVGPASHWSSPEFIGRGASPRVVMSEGGDAVLAWQAADSVVARRGLGSMLGWLSVEAIGKGYLPSGHPLAIDPDGRSILVWTAGPETSWDLYARRSSSSSPWGAAEGIDRGAAKSISAPSVEVGIDDTASATVLWLQTNGTSDTLYWNRFTAGTGWAQPERFDLQPGKVGEYRLVMNSDGYAIAMWMRVTDDPGSNQQRDLYARHFAPNSGWQPSVALSYGDPWRPITGMNSAGLGFVAWRACCRGEQIVWYDPTTGWTAQEELPLGFVEEAVLDERGNGLWTWWTWDAGPFVSYFSSEQGWGPAEPIGNFSSAWLRQAIDGMGNAFLMWIDFGDASKTVYTQRFVRSTIPDLILHSPLSILTSNPELTISGITNSGATLSIGGITVPVDLKGGFQRTVSLSDGTHEFRVVATGPEGGVRTVTVTRTVDTHPPTLNITSPTDGVTVQASSVAVAGITEPDSSVVVDGVLADVTLDGLFAVRVPLTEGENAIRIVASDAVGNTVTSSVRVTYVPSSVVAPSAAVLDSILLTGLVAASAALMGLLLLRFRDRRRKGPGGSQRLEPPRTTNHSGTEGGEGEDTRRKEETAEVGQRRNGNRSAAFRPQAVLPIRLTVKERFLLYLLSYTRYSEAAEVPIEMTQERIAAAAWIDQRHFSQYARPLVQDGLVQQRFAHVRDGRQRHRVYELTQSGRRVAARILLRIKSEIVPMWDGEHTWDVRIGEVLDKLRGKVGVLDLARHIAQGGIVDYAALSSDSWSSFSESNEKAQSQSDPEEADGPNEA